MPAGPGSRQTPPDLLITIPKDASGTLDLHRAEELIDLGRQMAIDALDTVDL